MKNSNLLRSICLLLAVIGLVYPLYGQQSRKKQPRTNPPKLSSTDFEGVFFDDVTKHLVGDPPSASDMAANGKDGTGGNTGSDPGGEAGAASGDGVWKERISAQSIEDLVKECKRRLDSVVTTPAKFAAVVLRMPAVNLACWRSFLLRRNCILKKFVGKIPLRSLVRGLLGWLPMQRSVLVRHSTKPRLAWRTWLPC